nr:hypothetical protein [Actinomadura craniellae]
MNAHLLTQARFDVLNALSEVCQLCAQTFQDRRIRPTGLAGSTSHRHPSQMILGETEGTRDGRKRRTRALAIHPLLDLPQRCRRDTRALSQFPLSDPTFLHPLVDRPRNGCPITHITLLTRG